MKCRKFLSLRGSELVEKVQVLLPVLFILVLETFIQKVSSFFILNSYFNLIPLYSNNAVVPMTTAFNNLLILNFHNPAFHDTCLQQSHYSTNLNTSTLNCIFFPHIFRNFSSRLCGTIITLLY